MSLVGTTKWIRTIWTNAFGLPFDPNPETIDIKILNPNNEDKTPEDVTFEQEDIGKWVVKFVIPNDASEGTWKLVIKGEDDEGNLGGGGFEFEVLKRGVK